MEDLARRVVEGIGAALLIVDENGRVTWSNPTAESLLGAGLAGRDLLRPEEMEDSPCLLVELAQRLAGAHASQEAGDLLVSPSAEGPRYFWMTSSSMGQNGTRTGARLVMLNDITGPLTASPFLRKVFSQVSHDLKSPLTSISGACELLGSGRVGSVGGTQMKLIGIIEDGSRRMGEILESVKGRFARSEQASGGAAHE